MNSETVPHGYWACDVCGTGNAIEYWPEHCPCTHKRGSCCAKAGDPWPVIQEIYHEPYQSQTTYSSGSNTPTTAAPGTSSYASSYHSAQDSFDGSFDNIGSKFSMPMSFMGSACFTRSVGSFPSTVPSCSSSEYSQVPTSYPIRTCSDAWLCTECGGANSDLTPDFCPVCGAPRSS
ncbi:hypothetical protein P154DRAFT_577396 [Amniculicola lignicola CBS 123094]|uniref:RanBP2-type domain-containing protein n=1 Tax=Amniculicola lignicola CBS 123094 TaxID=1392246 RepID=A0A6A5WC45_9PLEO|nr:hypothetical protein P154DRAFT_577396 [Amniculicola lignicola CBS 123094]